MPSNLTSIEPVRKAVTVPAAPQRAFELFTACIQEWWPLRNALGRRRARRRRRLRRGRRRRDRRDPGGRQHVRMGDRHRLGAAAPRRLHLACRSCRGGRDLRRGDVHPGRTGQHRGAASPLGLGEPRRRRDRTRGLRLRLGTGHRQLRGNRRESPLAKRPRAGFTRRPRDSAMPGACRSSRAAVTRRPDRHHRTFGKSKIIQPNGRWYLTSLSPSRTLAEASPATGAVRPAGARHGAGGSLTRCQPRVLRRQRISGVTPSRLGRCRISRGVRCPGCRRPGPRRHIGSPVTM